MLNNLIEKVKSLCHSLPYLMKGGDVLTTSNINITANENAVEQQVISNRLSKDLLKGEVTQQVEELRYRDYKVSKESKKYTYLGNGVAVKNKTINEFDGRIKFTQDNKIVCEGILHELERVGKYGTERYVLNVKYNCIPRFKVEKYCTRFKLEIGDDYTFFTMYFGKYADPYDVTSRMFINELGKIQDNDVSSQLLNSETEFSFVTYKASGEEDFISYTLSNVQPHNWGSNDGEYYIRFKVGEYFRNDLTEKFYSKSMDEKYTNHTPKEQVNSVAELKKTDYVCSECGRKVEEFFAIASISEHGKILCPKCWERALL